jgi:hypothetical protein
MNTNLLLIRDTFNEAEILGKLYINGEFMSHTLELPWRENMKSISCIPRGVYDCRIRRAIESGSYKYDHILVDEVVGRSWILFHIGNTHKDSKGCILTGEYRVNNDSIANSRIAHEQLMNVLEATKSNSIQLTIKNR